jgi:hypothetical protein
MAFTLHGLLQWTAYHQEKSDAGQAAGLPAIMLWEKGQDST